MALLDEIQAQLQARAPMPPLFPTQIFSREISQQIESSGVAPDLRAGLLLLNDDLHASHDISQSLHTPTGSFLHAVMHRREGDASNSNYWWRLTGDHPAFVPIYENALKYLQHRSEPEAQDFAAQMERGGRWNPSDFVRACSNARGDDEWLRGLQMAEISALLDWHRANN